MRHDFDIIIAANEQARSFASTLARKLHIAKIHVRQQSDPKYVHSVKRYAWVPTTGNSPLLMYSNIKRSSVFKSNNSFEMREHLR